MEHRLEADAHAQPEVDRLGGRIGFDSEPGVSTCFYFELPMMQQHWSIETGGERIVTSAGLAESAEQTGHAE